MNAPRSESQEKALKVVVEWYLQMEWEDAQLSAKAFESLAELLLICHKEGAQGQRMNFGWSSDPNKSVTFHEVPFNVTCPVTNSETLPGEEKKQ
jgi:hypothetical protein